MEVVKDNVVEAHKEIVEAQGHQKSTGKWMCRILTVIITVALILTIIFVVKASKK
jgi:hypothetical protein